MCASIGPSPARRTAGASIGMGSLPPSRNRYAHQLRQSFSTVSFGGSWSWMSHLSIHLTRRPAPCMRWSYLTVSSLQQYLNTVPKIPSRRLASCARLDTQTFTTVGSLSHSHAPSRPARKLSSVSEGTSAPAAHVSWGHELDSRHPSRLCVRLGAPNPFSPSEPHQELHFR